MNHFRIRSFRLGMVLIGHLSFILQFALGSSLVKTLLLLLLLLLLALQR